MVKKSLATLAMVSVLIFNSSATANDLVTGTTSFIETVPVDNRTVFYEGEEVFFFMHLDTLLHADIIWVFVYDTDGQIINRKLAKNIKILGTTKQLYWSSTVPEKKGNYSFKFFRGTVASNYHIASGTFSVSVGPSYEYVGPVGTCTKIENNIPKNMTNNFSQKVTIFIFGFVRIFHKTDFKITINTIGKKFNLEIPGKTARTNGLIFSSINLPIGEYDYKIFARENGNFVAIENASGQFFID
jgi:hypothetical protein